MTSGEVDDLVAYLDKPNSEPEAPKKRRQRKKKKSKTFDVEKILKVRFDEKKKRNEWFVKWEGFDESENSWEPRHCLEDTIAFHDFQENQTDYLVAQILKKRFNEELNQDEWLVQWTGYAEVESTWEPFSNLEGNEKFEAFENQADAGNSSS